MPIVLTRFLPTMDDLNQRVATLAATFRTIARERMIDVPILHAGLQVETVGFRPWRGDAVGVLVTPWCMNLVLLPARGAHGTNQPSGTIAPYTFPAGTFDFLLAHEGAFGVYGTCSLFSPMGEFADQEGAKATALAVMDELFRETHRTGDSQPAKSDNDRPPARQAMERPLSRRALLRSLMPRSLD